MRMFRILCFCLLTATVVLYAPPAFATPALMPAKNQAPFARPIPIVEQLGQQFQSLVVGTSAAQPPDQNDENNAEPAPTFGTKALNLVLTLAELVRTQAQTFVTNFAALPQLSGWFAQQTSDPRLHDRWISIGNDVLNIVGISLLAALILELVLYPLRRSLRQRRRDNARGIVTTMAMLFLLRALPIMLFIGASSCAGISFRGRPGRLVSIGESILA